MSQCINRHGGLQSAAWAGRGGTCQAGTAASNWQEFRRSEGPPDGSPVFPLSLACAFGIPVAISPQQIHRWLQQPEQAAEPLRRWGLKEPARAQANLLGIAHAGVPLDLLAYLATELEKHLPRLSDPDMALNNLERFISNSRNPLGLVALLERDPDSFPPLLQIFSVSQYLSDILVLDPEAFDLLRMTQGRPVSRQSLVDELTAEVMALQDQQLVMRALRRFKQRETLRIAYGDIIQEQPLETVTAQISYVADAILEAAVAWARGQLQATRGVPRLPNGRPARFVVLGMGKLGGVELNYSSDIDLIFIYEGEGKTDGPRPWSNQEFFNRLGRWLLELLTTRTELGQAYRVDMRLRPEGNQGPLVVSWDHARHYYDVKGRTWERQAYVKARAVAGDLDFGAQYLQELEPWVYRRYLGIADIADIKALKRRIERHTAARGKDASNVKTGVGGIRDIEFVIQFLQLLNGGDLPELRTTNTLTAIDRLEHVGCLTHQERTVLETNYRFLRKIEHRLQIMFDLQTHELPQDEQELRKLALRVGFEDTPRESALDAFRRMYAQATELNRKILNHLLHDAFADDRESTPEVDLVLDPDPSRETIQQVLGPYGFKDPQQAYHHLMGLATERIPFLSTRRCRHFLASIAPQLLKAISQTPDPDATLITLEQVSDSLGGKGVLWELFSFNPPSLQLYVKLCASSPYLCSILISNPGMIDELLDSLLLDRLPELEGMRHELAELTRGAEDLDPILHSFKNAKHLQVGVRDVMDKESLPRVTACLSDVAQVCLEQVIHHCWQQLVPRLGVPQHAGGPCPWVVLAMGKFGGREMNYHSDVDLVFLYAGEGHTQAATRGGGSTTNQHFFSELGSRVIKTMTYLGPYGRLYEVDARLRPTGRSGALATSLAEFRRYFQRGEGQLWERQALCKARVLSPDERAAQAAEQAVLEAMTVKPLGRQDVESIYQMRMKLQQTASAENIKRGPGGIVDVEFAVQMLQLCHMAQHPELRVANTLEALQRLHELGLMAEEDARFWRESYLLLRRVESRLQLLNLASHDQLPQAEEQLRRVASLLGYKEPEQFRRQVHECTAEVRRRFDRLFQQQAAALE